MDHHIIKQKEKEREKERFEPIPLYAPLFEMPAFEDYPQQESKATEEEETERGIWTIQL